MQLRKRERSSDGNEVGNVPPSKKSKPSESSANDVNMSTSTYSRDSSVHHLIYEQQQSRSHQRSVRFDLGHSLSSGVAQAEQHGNYEPDYNIIMVRPPKHHTLELRDLFDFNIFRRVPEKNS